MKGSALVAASLLILLLLVVPHSTVSARHISRPSSSMRLSLCHILLSFSRIRLCCRLILQKYLMRVSSRFEDHGHRHSTRPKAKVEHVANPNFYWERRLSMRPGRADTVRIAGSSLPDCSHACGSCSPCRLVMVSFVCASVQEAETCPMAYKCMCNKKSYPVP
ncbi:uncharacterized protein LOC115728634 isoform X1 [Rhodamnia argentea]|uniref:Epidermal patterning factor-like protein n=1 Tax=Rhodamnia argentea TaxID=178133 RepID=A0ABM3HMQ3_9MYRT|nr:uncharacterized protein LOC115728634 isoform X1 [Rhodamnia argentea]